MNTYLIETTVVLCSVLLTIFLILSTILYCPLFYTVINSNTRHTQTILYSHQLQYQAYPNCSLQSIPEHIQVFAKFPSSICVENVNTKETNIKNWTPQRWEVVSLFLQWYMGQEFKRKELQLNINPCFQFHTKFPCRKSVGAIMYQLVLVLPPPPTLLNPTTFIHGNKAAGGSK